MASKVSKKMDIKLFKIKYYLKRKDPEFENKMHNVLVKPFQISIPTIPLQRNRVSFAGIVNIRLGEVLLLAGIDLLTGETIPLISESHKIADFIEFLKIMDKKYPEGDNIRLIPDNHSAHKSKEAKLFLSTLPESRFEFVFTPTHLSWLNMIGSFFSKMTKQMLKGIRVTSKEELADRIYRYFDEINAEPIVYHWIYKLNEIDVS